jgi:membrane protein YdbS with pleckstrin-like domain
VAGPSASTQDVFAWKPSSAIVTRHGPEESPVGLSSRELGPDEQLVIETREHWRVLLGPALICALALAGVAGLFVVAAGNAEQGALAVVGLCVFAVVVPVWVVRPLLAWRSRTYVLTTERLAIREGVLRRSGRDIPLDRINDTRHDRSLVDRMMGCGTLQVSAASEHGTVVLKGIPRVFDFIREMNRLSRAARGGRGDGWVRPRW